MTAQLPEMPAVGTVLRYFGTSYHVRAVVDLSTGSPWIVIAYWLSRRQRWEYRCEHWSWFVCYEREQQRQDEAGMIYDPEEKPSKAPPWELPSPEERRDWNPTLDQYCKGGKG